MLVDSEIIAHRIVAKGLNRLGCAMTIEESIRIFTGISKQTSHKILLEKYGIDVPDTFWDQEQERILKAFEIELADLNKNALKQLVQKK